jgi:hypothetical protein
MSWRRLRQFRVRFRGRGGSWLALAGQVIAVIGLPLPPVSAKDLSKPFLCQHRACGCLSASSYWTSCCCFSAGARVAWAREHGVEPPNELVAEAEDAEDRDEREQSKPGCCTKPTDETTQAQTKSTRWLLIVQAKRCQGPAGEADATPACPPGLPVVWRYEWTVTGLAPSITLAPVDGNVPPPNPPPRSI